MNAVVGVNSDGLAITVLPEIRGGAIFQVNKYSGRFHGEIQPTTPIGEFNIIFKSLPVKLFIVCLSKSAKNFKFCTSWNIYVGACMNGLSRISCFEKSELINIFFNFVDNFNKYEALSFVLSDFHLEGETSCFYC